MADEPIICNSSPLVALSMIGHLDLLKQLYHRVIVPKAVIREVVESGLGRIGAHEVETASWLERKALDIPPDPLLANELGSGESEVIAMAFRLNAGLVLIDERRARRIAEQAYNLRVKGSAGILVAAKKANLIPAIKPLLESMAAQSYYLSHRLIERACREAGE